jgi:uncharacterized protein
LITPYARNFLDLFSMSILSSFITPMTLLGALAFSASTSATQAQAQQASGAAPVTLPITLSITTLNVGIHNIQAELAQTEDERSTGLMNRPELGAHQGMLFVFDSAAQQCFWMKNTLIPLSIAFLADDGTIVHIANMQPQSLDSHCSPKPVRLALEVNQGWFSKRGIKVGMKINTGKH